MTTEEPENGRTPLAELEAKEGEDDGCLGERTIWTRIWQGLAAASMAVAIAAMAIEASGVAFAYGVIACVIAPIVFFKQFQLQNIDTLRMVQNALRKEVNRLMGENDKLSSEVTRLKRQVGRLKETETKLDEITKEQGTNVKSFVALVKENQEIINELKVLVRAELTQTLVTACIDSDFDMSGHFSDQEIKMLELRMKNVPGVHVNHELLVKKVEESDRGLATVLELLQQLEVDDVPEEERIFRLDEKEISARGKRSGAFGGLFSG